MAIILEPIYQGESDIFTATLIDEAVFDQFFIFFRTKTGKAIERFAYPAKTGFATMSRSGDSYTCETNYAKTMTALGQTILETHIVRGSIVDKNQCDYKLIKPSTAPNAE